jgi:L-ribulose-5-phosphate 3-epimerase
VFEHRNARPGDPPRRAFAFHRRAAVATITTTPSLEDRKRPRAMNHAESSPAFSDHEHPSRRSLLRVGLAATAWFATARSKSAAQENPVTPPTSKPTRSIRRCLKYGMVAGDGSILDKFKLLKDLGYDGVEMDSPARDATGLLIPGVVDSAHWQLTLGDPDESIRAQGRAALETALRDAKRLGASTVLLVPAVVNERIGYAEAYTRSQHEIRQVLPLAKDLGVKIAFENVWNNFLLSPLEAARYVDEFESDMIGWYLDVGNLVNFAWPEQWARVLKHRVLKLDFKEFSRKKRNDEGLWKGFDVEMLEGDNNWPAVMQALDEIGYQGWASAEVPGGDATRLKDVLARMDRILAL